MNSLTSFVSKLMPKTSADMVTRAIDDFYEDIKKNIRPMYNINDDVGKRSGLYSTVDNGLKNSRNLPGYRGMLIRFIRETLDELIKNETEMKSFMQSRFKTDILKESLDYEHAQLMHVVSGFGFFADYARKLSVSLIRTQMEDPYRPVDKMFESFCKNASNIETFAIMLNIARAKPKDFAGAMKKLSNVSFSEDNQDVVRATMGDDADPYKTGFLGVGAIGYIIGQFYNKYIVWRYDMAKETKLKQEQLLIYLEREAAGASGEELEAIKKQIAYYDNNINKLSAYIEEIEADAGI